MTWRRGHGQRSVLSVQRTGETAVPHARALDHRQSSVIPGIYCPVLRRTARNGREQACEGVWAQGWSWPGGGVSGLLARQQGSRKCRQKSCRGCRRSRSNRPGMGCGRMSARKFWTVTVCGDSGRPDVVAWPEGPAQEHPKPWMLDEKEACPGAAFTFAQNQESATISTPALKVGFSMRRGNLTFENAAGDSILREGNAVPMPTNRLRRTGRRRGGSRTGFRSMQWRRCTGLGSTGAACSTIAAQRSSWRRTIPMWRSHCFFRPKVMA